MQGRRISITGIASAPCRDVCVRDTVIVIPLQLERLRYPSLKNCSFQCPQWVESKRQPKTHGENSILPVADL